MYCALLVMCAIPPMHTVPHTPPSPPPPTHSDAPQGNNALQVLSNITLAMGKLQLVPAQDTRTLLAQHAKTLHRTAATCNTSTSSNTATTPPHARPQSLLHLFFGLALLDALQPAALLDLQHTLEPHAGALTDVDWQHVYLMTCVAGVPAPPSPPPYNMDEEEIWQTGGPSGGGTGVPMHTADGGGGGLGAAGVGGGNAAAAGGDDLDLDAMWQAGLNLSTAAALDNLSTAALQFSTTTALNPTPGGGPAIIQQPHAAHTGPLPPAAAVMQEQQEVGSPDLEPDWACLWQAGTITGGAGLGQQRDSMSLGQQSTMSLGQPSALRTPNMQDVLSALQRGTLLPPSSTTTSHLATTTTTMVDDDLAGIWQLGPPLPPPPQPDLGLLLLQYAATLPAGQQRSVHAYDTDPVRYMGPLAARAQEAWVHAQRCTPYPACCDAVEDLLKLLGLTYVRGYWTEQGIRVEFLIRHGQLRVALVCCRGGDYACNAPEVLVCPEKVLTHRALSRCGYRVAVLDEDAWGGQSAGQNVLQLLGVLSGAGVDLERASPALMNACRQVQQQNAAEMLLGGV